MIGIDSVRRQAPPLDVDSGNEFAQDGSDLYFADYPDDMVIAKERIAWLKEQGQVMNPAVLQAESVVFEIMDEFRRDGDVFHPRTDEALRAHLYEQMRARVSARLGARAAEIATNAWLADRIASIHGFPPYRYEEAWAED